MPDVLSPGPASDPSLYTPNVAPNTPAAPPPGGYVPPPPGASPGAPSRLDEIATALAVAQVYLDRPAHDATFRAALEALEAPALAVVQDVFANGGDIPQAIQVCDFYGDFGGPLEDAFQDILDEHADMLAGHVLRLAVGDAPAGA